jgi:hypothetical protein
MRPARRRVSTATTPPAALLMVTEMPRSGHADHVVCQWNGSARQHYGTGASRPSTWSSNRLCPDENADRMHKLQLAVPIRICASRMWSNGAVDDMGGGSEIPVSP